MEYGQQQKTELASCFTVELTRTFCDKPEHYIVSRATFVGWVDFASHDISWIFMDFSFNHYFTGDKLLNMHEKLL